MNILLLGSGGREHAIAWKISQSPKVDKLFIAPGNAGTAQVGTNAYIKADDFAAIKDFVLANDVNMVVVGPEDPLVKGVYDFFKNDLAGRHPRDRSVQSRSAAGRQQRLCQSIHDAP